MTTKNIMLLAIMAILWSCAPKPSANTSSPEEGVETTASADLDQEGKFFGEKISAEGAITFTELVTELEDTDSLAAKVTGTVQEVCQAKGCWMNISDSEGGERSVFVKFKDYGFFMPKDIAGQQVIMEGYAYREVTPVDELRHFAEDAGKTAEEVEAITEPKEELKFLASGVIVLEKND